MSRGGAAGLVNPDAASAKKIWDTLRSETAKEQEYFLKEGDPINTMADMAVECDSSGPLIHALFLQTFFAKWGFLPDAGADKIMEHRRNPTANSPLSMFLDDLLNFEEALMDYLNDRVYTEGHTDKMCSELSPPLIGQASERISVISRITRMGNLSCSMPSSMELIDIVGNVIRQGIARETGFGGDANPSVSRFVEFPSVGPFPLVFISRMSIAAPKGGMGGSMNAGLSATIGPDATIRGFHFSGDPFIPKPERNLMVENYERFFDAHRKYNGLKVESDTYAGAPLFKETNKKQATLQQYTGIAPGVEIDTLSASPYGSSPSSSTYALIPVGFYEISSSTDAFVSPSKISVALVPAYDALLSYYDMGRARNVGNLG